MIAGCRPMLWIGLALFSTGVGAACASECTLVACNPHAAIELSPELDLSENDKLEVTLDDKAKIDCTAKECSDSRVTWIYRGESSTAGGGATQSAGGNPVGISVQGKPKSIVVRLYTGAELAGETEVKPKYLESEINGPGCGVCDIATSKATLALP